jgi:hypothetical protein
MSHTCAYCPYGESHFNHQDGHAPNYHAFSLTRERQTATISEAEWRARVTALERQCAVLAAEVDRMRPVVEATVKQIRRDDDLFSWSDLKVAVDVYEAAKEQG